MNFLVITLLATGSSALSLTKDLKAASHFVNLGCQCSSLTFVDSHGQVTPTLIHITVSLVHPLFMSLFLPLSCLSILYLCRCKATAAQSTQPELVGAMSTTSHPPARSNILIHYLPTIAKKTLSGTFSSLSNFSSSVEKNLDFEF